MDNLQEAFDKGFAAVKSYVDTAIGRFERRLAELEARKPEKGEKGDQGDQGEKGEPAVIELADVIDALMPEVAKWLEENKPQDGKDGRDGVDGKTVTVDDVKPLIEEFISREIAALPKAKDGVGVAGAVIDRGGKLVLTLTDGATKDLGVVVGRDGTNGKDGEKGEPGRDGFGLEDFVIEQDGDRTVTFKFQRGDIVKAHSVKFNSLIDRGVWTEGNFEKGDGVTWGGSYWIAQCDTKAKPETNKDWRLAVRRGRDGKPGKDGDRGPEGKKGEKGDPGPRGFTV